MQIVGLFINSILEGTFYPVNKRNIHTMVGVSVRYTSL